MDWGGGGGRGSIGGVRLPSGLSVGRRVLERGLLLAVGLGPELLLQLLHHPLQVLPGLPLLQQVGPQLLAVGLGVLQLHLEVFDLQGAAESKGLVKDPKIYTNTSSAYLVILS